MRSENTDENSKSWTDDLPKCECTGVGKARRLDDESNGYRSLDRSFYCSVDENTCLYAVFSGINGVTVSELAIQRTAAEILLGQLNGKSTEEEVKDVLRQAFIAVEKCYYESIDSLLASKTALQCQFTDRPKEKEAIKNALQNIVSELSIGSSAALCLIYNSKLYICNVGTCRVLLCKSDENKAPRVIQFSVDHNLLNEDEILRLQQSGLDVKKLKNFPIDSTRCLGYYAGKSGYKDYDVFKGATSEPIIAQPEIVGGIPIDESFQFLLLMSSGMCKVLQEIYAGDVVKENKEIVRITAKEYEMHESLPDIAQSVVNKVLGTQKESSSNSENSLPKREDMTLILRNFYAPILRRIKPNQVTFNSCVQEVPTNYDDTLGSEPYTTNRTDTTTTISSFEQKQKEIFDKNRKIQPYVDFRSFYANVEKAKKEGILPADIEFD